MTPEELHNIFKSESEFWWYRGMRAITAALLDPWLAAKSAGDALAGLDAGCGTGFNALQLEKTKGLTLFGVDLAPLGIAYCRKRGFERSAVASITQLPFPDSRFDLVITLDVLSHLPAGDDRRALAEFARVLRPGGIVLIRVPAFRSLRSRHSAFIAETHRYRALELRRMLADAGTDGGADSGFDVLDSTYANALLSPIAFLKFRVVENLAKAPASSGVEEMPPRWMNHFLERILRAEAALLRLGMRFPFGQSLIVVARKRKGSRAAD